MRNYPIIFFSAVFCLEWLSGQLEVLPKSVTLTTDILAVLCFIYVVARASQTGSITVPVKYILLCILLIVHMLAGILANEVPTAAIVSGIRQYWKFAPLFLLPFFLPFSDADLRFQFKVLLGLASIQIFPVLYQKFILNLHQDDVTGMLSISSVLSIYLISCISVMVAAYLKGKISVARLLSFGVLLFIPPILNESKGALVLLPIAVVVILAVSGQLRSQSMKVIWVSSFSFILIASYISLFDVIYPEEAGKESIADFFTDSSKLEHYLFSGSSLEFDPDKILSESSRVHTGVGEEDVNAEDERVGRIDGILIAFRALATKPVNLFLGVGLGNLSRSLFGIGGGDFEYLEAVKAGNTGLDALIWEIGVLGLLLYLIFFIFVFWDSIRAATLDSWGGVLSLGWCGVTTMFLLALPYKNFLHFDVMGYLFWYFSGVVVVLGVNESRRKVLRYS